MKIAEPGFAKGAVHDRPLQGPGADPQASKPPKLNVFDHFHTKEGPIVKDLAGETVRHTLTILT